MAFATGHVGGTAGPPVRSQATAAAIGRGRVRGRTVRQRLRAFVVVGVLMVVVVAAAGLASVQIVRDQTDQINDLVRARDHVLVIGRQLDALRTNVDRAVFASQGLMQFTDEEAQQAFLERTTVIATELTAVQATTLPASAQQAVADLTAPVTAFMIQADRLSALAFTDAATATASLSAFDDLAAQVAAKQAAATAALDDLVARARQRSGEVPGQTAIFLVCMVVVTVLLLGLGAFVLGRSLRRSLSHLGDVARSIARGQLDSRVAIRSEDELGVLGHAINDMATDLQALVRQMEATAERDGFGSQLSEALEMADTESEALRMIERAMTSISSTAPMEILLADSSKAHLGRAASNPDAGAPCCPVESPFSCVAVRRGNPVVFDSSEALNACPKLRDRASGPVSAVCVPVTFMGRALGVLHATGPIGSPLGTDAVSQLTALATQSGGRIGTVRSFERSQLQATTDGLTGLRNRRTIETELRGLLNDGEPLVVVMADLDHFKLLNDTYGHDAGDRALRKFAQTLEASLRDSDIAGRFGGEEFVIALPGATVATAVETLDRLRERLASATEESGNPTFTASFGVVDASMGPSLEELLRIADAALYRAKNEGRNRVTIADERDVDAASRPGDPSGHALSRAQKSYTAAGAFERAASLDDPMPDVAQHR